MFFPTEEVGVRPRMKKKNQQQPQIKTRKALIQVNQPTLRVLSACKYDYLGCY